MIWVDFTSGWQNRVLTEKEKTKFELKLRAGTLRGLSQLDRPARECVKWGWGTKRYGGGMTVGLDEIVRLVVIVLAEQQEARGNPSAADRGSGRLTDSELVDGEAGR